MTFNKGTVPLVNVSASAPPLDWSLAPGAVSTRRMSLAELVVGTPGAVVSVDLEEDLVRWLAAIGIGRGDRVTVLRAAPFGGPIHLRTHTGGEFAVDRSLARSIQLEAVKPARNEEQKGAA